MLVWKAMPSITPDDVRDLARAGVDLVHGVDHLAHYVAATLGDVEADKAS